MQVVVSIGVESETGDVYKPAGEVHPHSNLQVDICYLLNVAGYVSF